MNTYDTINLNDYVWKQDLPFMEYIKSRGFEIIPIDYDDEMHYANNFLTIAPRHIMAVGGQSEILQQRFHEAGVTVDWIPLESLIDGYGAAHCMTQVLQREAFDGQTTGLKAVRQAATGQLPIRRYCLDGTPATDASRGIVIENGRKSVK